ncbi:MAG: hypothetical protein A3E91_03805 [Candidatus Moranbacteria bacterium RIFCSPHIGHO2_12_FULL_40_10]|nr:MAG: hypothetical protein A3E91_03805 [Candidatus Moranbacteria bacterium RIFCSPHIGHO2_12_FULL_40_10]
MDRLSNLGIKEISSGEEVIKIVHRHWFDILGQYLISFMIFFAMAGVLIVIPVYFPGMHEQGDYLYIVFFESFVALILWIFGFIVWIDYYLDIWIVTSERVINIEQKGLFNRIISELKLSRIQDVTTEVNGIIQTVLNFGDVHIQTAGEESKFFLRHIPDPGGIKSILMDLQKNKEKEETDELGEMIEKKIHENTIS